MGIWYYPGLFRWPNVITKGLKKWKREIKEASMSDWYDARKETDPCWLKMEDPSPEM